MILKDLKTTPSRKVYYLKIVKVLQISMIDFDLVPDLRAVSRNLKYDLQAH